LPDGGVVVSAFSNFSFGNDFTALRFDSSGTLVTGFQEFDISELSISSHTMMTSRGSNAYVGIPAFVSRLFRHSGVYIRTDRGIDKPQDLAGKTVGLPEYQITANVWIRGILEDDFGVKPSSIHWRRGGVEDPGRLERAPIKLPPDVEKPLPAPSTRTVALPPLLAVKLSGRAPSPFNVMVCGLTFSLRMTAWEQLSSSLPSMRPFLSVSAPRSPRH
jgi:hypothetical protein